MGPYTGLTLVCKCLSCTGGTKPFPVSRCGSSAPSRENYAFPRPAVCTLASAALDRADIHCCLWTSSPHLGNPGPFQHHSPSISNPSLFSIQYLPYGSHASNLSYECILSLPSPLGYPDHDSMSLWSGIRFSSKDKLFLEASWSGLDLLASWRASPVCILGAKTKQEGWVALDFSKQRNNSAASPWFSTNFLCILGFFCMLAALHCFWSPITTTFEANPYLLPNSLCEKIFQKFLESSSKHTDVSSISIWSLLSNPEKPLQSSMAKLTQEKLKTNQVIGTPHPKPTTCPSVVIWLLLGNHSSTRSYSVALWAGFDFSNGDQI